jgi:hypothetical protein
MMQSVETAPGGTALDEFKAMLDASLGISSRLEGTVVKGTVVRIDNDEVVDNQVWNQLADFTPLVLNFEYLLLIDRMTALQQFDDEGVFIELLVKSRFQLVQDRHGRAQDMFTRCFVNQFPHIRVIRAACSYPSQFCFSYSHPCHQCHPWLTLLFNICEPYYSPTACRAFFRVITASDRARSAPLRRMDST